MCCFLARALPPLLGCCVRFRLAEAPTVVLVVFPTALDLIPVPGPVHYPSLVRLAHSQGPATLVCCPGPVGRMLPRSVRPSVLPVPVVLLQLESVPSPVAEFLRP